MALGFSSKKGNAASDSPALPNAPLSEKSEYGNKGHSADSYDPENLGSSRRGSRIVKPITKPIIPDSEGDDSSSAMSVGKQMELEAGNAIKYRTCSWPKVRFCCHLLSSFIQFFVVKSVLVSALHLGICLKNCITQSYHWRASLMPSRQPTNGL
jgi:hypothetical protein